MRVRRWLVTGPVAARLISPLLALPIIAALAETTKASGAQPQWLIVVVVIAGAVIRTIRKESSSRRVREAVFDGIRTGVPTGDPAIDRVIEDRLVMAARGALDDRSGDGAYRGDLRFGLSRPTDDSTLNA